GERALAAIADRRLQVPADAAEHVDDAALVRDFHLLTLGGRLERAPGRPGGGVVGEALAHRLRRGHATVELVLLAGRRILDDRAGGLVGAREHAPEHHARGPRDERQETALVVAAA